MADEKDPKAAAPAPSGLDAIFDFVITTFIIVPIFWILGISMKPVDPKAPVKPKDSNTLETFIGFFYDKFGVSPLITLWVLFVSFLWILSDLISNFSLFTWSWILGLIPIWLPAMLIGMSWAMWIYYVRAAFIAGKHPILLDIKIPREISKSPRAMEIALNNFYATSGEGTYIDRAWKGSVRTWFSLEYASFGGDVHMYVWCWSYYKAIVESSLYSQFGDIEMREVEDYASKFAYDHHKYEAFCFDYMYGKKPKYVGYVDAYPLKSYIDFELDKDPKEEFKVEPLATLFENLSALEPWEQLWVQIIIRANGYTSGIFNKVDSDYLDRCKAEIQFIRKQSQPEGKDGFTGFPNPTGTQKLQMETIERHMAKTAFDVGMRVMYIAAKPHGLRPTFIANTMKLFAPLASDTLNKLAPTRGHIATGDFPWMDYNNIRKQIVAYRFFDAFRRRSWFHAPWETPHNVMSVETLATLFHFPSSTVKSPGLVRIPATKAEAPNNLPM